MSAPRLIIPHLQKVGIDKVRRHFESKVRKPNPETGCTEWAGGRRRHGYGAVSISGKTYLAHRLSYVLAHGRDPGHLCVCHSCDNPPCVNPAHLWLGTVGDNTRDMCAKGRKPDHRGELNPRAKLTPDQVRAIRADPRGYQRTAKAYGVNNSTIREIRKGISWSSLT